jgi:hypothetical protein
MASKWTRRGFLKGSAGVASLPILQKLGFDKLFGGIMSQAKPTAKPFSWSELINLVKTKGDIVNPNFLGSVPRAENMAYMLDIGNGRTIEVIEPTYRDITQGGDTNTYIDIFNEEFDIEGGAFDAPVHSVTIGKNQAGESVGEIMGDAKFQYMGPEDAGDWDFDSSGSFEGETIEEGWLEDFTDILEDASKVPIMKERAKIEQKSARKTKLPATKKSLRLPKLSAIAKFAAKRNLPMQLLQIASQMGGSNLLNWGEEVMEQPAVQQATRLLESPEVQQEITRLQDPLEKRHGGIVSINELVAA